MTNRPFWSLGFRPFFLGASVFAAVAMAAWLAVYRYGLPIETTGLSPSQWHAHEMVFGFAFAVIAGFLLTATWNWTDQETASGGPLAMLFAAWALARVLMLSGTGLLWFAAAADLAFMLGLAFAVARPIIKVGQKRQAPILLILALLTAANLLFYLGAAGWIPHGVHYGVHGGLYLVLGLVLFMGSRVIPFFTERGVGYEVQLKRRRWNDVATSALFPPFLLSEVLLPHHLLGASLAAALLILNSVRVSGWYTLGIWQKPLLWGLFAAFMMINLGFLLRALMPVTAIPDYLPIHAFAVGGIGLVTVSMMARVALGHTGRNVHQSPPAVMLLLVGMALSVVIRVFLPLVDIAHYTLWVTVSGFAWIVTFALFVLVFAPLLIRPRADAPKPPPKPGAE
jgi:uncharacterized protein involved in response to NO